MAKSFGYKQLDTNGFWDITKGLGVNVPNRPPDKDGKLINGANASLTYNGYMIGLWVNGINTDFALNGTTGQGPFNQDFYPHNLNTPTLAISGQTVNGRQKNRLSDFIRWTHSQTIKKSSNDPSSLVLFRLNTNKQYNVRTQKGSPSPFTVYGYIDTIPIGATRFVTAYTYTFNFNIAYTTDRAKGTNRFMGLQFTPSSIAQLQSITQWSTEPNNKVLFEKPGSNKTINEKTQPKHPLGYGVLAPSSSPDNFTAPPSTVNWTPNNPLGPLTWTNTGNKN